MIRRWAVAWGLAWSVCAAGCGGATVVSLPPLDESADSPHVVTPARPPTAETVADPERRESLPLLALRSSLNPVALGEPPPVEYPLPCAKIFDDDQLQTFEIEIAQEHWDALQADFLSGGQSVDVYRPLRTFRHAGKQTQDAMIRLRGNPNSRNEQQKMQFQISFNENDPDGRFRGLRKIVLDANHYSKTYLRDRLAMSMARDVGLPAACVNHVRLYVNGQFYGLYGNLEKIDREFLERNFADPSANLYKRGQIQKTNEDEAPDPEAVHTFWDSRTPQDLERVADLRQMIRAWALEAVIPDADGYWAGGWNFYLYDHPERGFLYLLWDVDLAFTAEPVDVDPLTWRKTNTNFNGRPHVEAVLADPYWRGEFIKEVRFVRDAIDEKELLARLNKWAAQIRDSAYEDRLAPWTGEEHERAVASMKRHLSARLDFLDDWLRAHEAQGSDDGEEN